MDLSKVFDMLNHNLLLCKFQVYGINKNTLTFIQIYFTNRHQQTKVGDNGKRSQKCAPRLHSCSFIFEHTHLSFFFYIETTTLCNYVDDNNMYSSDKNSNIVISILGHDFAIISEWFYENQMVLNPDKYHFLTLGFNEPFSEFLKIPSLKTSPGKRFLG